MSQPMGRVLEIVSANHNSPCYHVRPCSPDIQRPGARLEPSSGRPSDPYIRSRGL